MPNGICPTIINLIDEIKEKISNAEYKKICDELQSIHNTEQMMETSFYKMEYEIIDIIIHCRSDCCDACGEPSDLITETVTHISNKLYMCVPAIERNGDDKVEYCIGVLMKILKDGYIHKCETDRALNFLAGSDYDITPGICGNLVHKTCVGNRSDGFTIKKICRVNKFEKINCDCHDYNYWLTR